MVVLEVMITAWTFGVPIVELVRLMIDTVKDMKIIGHLAKG